MSVNSFYKCVLSGWLSLNTLNAVKPHFHCVPLIVLKTQGRNVQGWLAAAATESLFLKQMFHI